MNIFIYYSWFGAVNNAADELVKENPNKDWETGELRLEAEKSVRESGYRFAKGKSRSGNVPCQMYSKRKAIEKALKDKEDEMKKLKEVITIAKDKMEKCCTANDITAAANYQVKLVKYMKLQFVIFYVEILIRLGR